MMDYEWSAGGNPYEDHFENNGFLTSLVEDEQHYHPNNGVPQNAPVQNFAQPDPAQGHFGSHQLPAYPHPIPDVEPIVDQTSLNLTTHFCTPNDIQGQPNDESLYSLLHEDNQSYWTQNGYQNGHHGNNQFSYYQTDPYQQGYSQLSGYTEDYGYWDSRHYQFQPNQAPVYTDYSTAPQYQMDQPHTYGVNNVPNHIHHLHHHHPHHHHPHQHHVVIPPPVIPEKPLLKCDTCDKTFTSQPTLQRHKKRKDHDNVKDYKCELCNDCFPLSQHLKRHYERVHRKLIGDDGQAATGLPSLSTVYGQKKNTRKVSDLITGLIELFECYYCHEVFQRYDDFRDHLSSVHADLKKYVCPHKFCKANFNTVDELLEHARKGNAHEKLISEKKSTSLACSICRAEFSRRDALKRHEKGHAKKRLECPFKALSKCTRTFYRIDDLKSHLERHNDPKFKSTAFSCDICSRIFATSSQLDKHKTVHPNPKFKIYCPHCHEGFRHPHRLRIHACPAKKAKGENISNSLKAHHRKARLKKSRKKSDDADHSSSDPESVDKTESSAI